jgi:hypothetical protein
MIDTWTVIAKGISLLASLWLFFILAIPGITVWMAQILESWAGILRRHATAMRAAYVAYGASWKEQRTV